MQAPPIVRDYALGDRVFVNDTAEARAAVRELAALKPDLLKHHNAMTRAVFFAVLDEAKKAGLRVAGHFPMGEKVTLREVAESGQASIEHLGWPGASADFKAMSPAGQDSLVSIVKASGLAFVPTFVVGAYDKESAPGADSIRFVQSHQDPRARFVTAQLWDVWAGIIKVLEATRKSGLTSQYDFNGEIAMLRRFHKAGVPILPGTDFTVQFLFPGSSAQEEVANLVSQVGMTPGEAIQAASRRSAELMGLGAETGTIETGKSADLFLVDADPLADIKNTQRVVGVARQGRFFDRAQLDSLLNEAGTRLQKK
jgi:imidazolonepropionase-like amidohydrolase